MCHLAVLSHHQTVSIRRLDEAMWIIRIAPYTRAILPHQGTAELYTGTTLALVGMVEEWRRIFSH